MSSLGIPMPANGAPSYNRSQAPHSNGEHETQFDFNDFEHGEEFQDLQNFISAQDSFGTDQLEGGPSNGQPQFQFEFSAEDWKAYDDYMANEEFSEIPYLEIEHEQRIKRRLEKAKTSGASKDHNGRQHHANQNVSPMNHEPYSDEILDNYSYHSQPPLDSRQWSAVNTPAMDSGYGTAAMSRETTNGLIPSTPYQLSNAVGSSSLGNMQLASGDVYAAVTSPADGNYDAFDEEEVVPSQPTFRTYEERDPLIVQNPRKAKWGRTGTRNRVEVWFNPETSKWQPSASHHSMRATLIAKAQAEYPNDRYLFPDPTDGLPHGETAFFKPHQNRGPHRNDCADSLFVWRDYIPKTDAAGKYTIKTDQPKTIRNHPGFMYEGGKILLNPHDNPVVDHKFIPLTLSSRTHGSKLQEMALHPECQQVDLWARMPRWERTTFKNGNVIVRELRGKNTRINMPMTRFREKKGTIAGCDRECSDVIRAGLLKFYHYHGYDPVASGNSLRGFPRDLLPFEAKQVRLGNKARLGNRAGDRALDDDAREKDYQKTLQSIERGMKKQAAQDGDAAGKRRLEDEDADSQDFNRGPRKRGRRHQEADAESLPYDERYTAQFKGPSPTFEDGRHGYAIHGYDHGRQQNGTFNASVPLQEGFNMYGTSEGLCQYPTIQDQPPAEQNQFDSNWENSGIETSITPAQNEFLQTSHGGVNYQWTPKPLPTGPRQKKTMPAVQAPANNDIRAQHSYPAEQYPQSNTGTERGPIVGPGQPHQTGYLYEPVHYDHHNVIQNRPMTSIYGQANANNNVLPAQDQEPFEGTNGGPKRGGNTLGPGGRRTHPVPKQTLGKRGQREAGDVENDENKRTWDATESRRPVPDSQKYNSEFEIPALPKGTQQEQGNLEANPDPDFGSSHKRQRNNATPGTEPRPQHRQTGRAPRPKYYGAGGAPESLLPLEDPFGYAQSISTFNGYQQGPLKSPEELELFPTTQLTSDLNGDAEVAEGPLLSPEELFGTAPYDFDFDENAGVQGSLYGNTPYGDVYGGLGLVAPSNESKDQGISAAQSRRSEYLQHVPGGWMPQHILGKHGQEEPSCEGQQVGYELKNNHEPKPKRRHMPSTEGYYSPPAQAPKAAVVQKARKAARDAQLPPPQLHINETIPDSYQAPQVEDAYLTAPEVYIKDSAINSNEAPHVADAQGTDPPQSRTPARTGREAPADIRDLRPVNAWQSQSLNNALRYSRENFSEWTGEEAPVTNLEDCYNVQYREIRAAFKIWWRSEKNPLRSEPLPKVWRMKAWSGTVENWRVPTNMEHLHEPMRRGRWAARNANGSLRQPEFHWDYQKYEWYDVEAEERL